MLSFYSVLQQFNEAEIICSFMFLTVILILIRAYVFWQDANSGNITKIGKERARGD